METLAAKISEIVWKQFHTVTHSDLFHVDTYHVDYNATDKWPFWTQVASLNYSHKYAHCKRVMTIVCVLRQWTASSPEVYLLWQQ
jgi:hypothetical protein